MTRASRFLEECCGDELSSRRVVCVAVPRRMRMSLILPIFGVEVAVVRHRPRAIDRHIDYFGEPRVRHRPGPASARQPARRARRGRP